jgi:hypothetical protein
MCGGFPHVSVCLLVGAIVLADVFDGQAFEWSASSKDRSQRQLRHCVDAIADRIVIHSVFITAILVYDVSWAVYAVIVAREVVLTALVLRPWLYQGLVVRANTPSKLATALIAVIGLDQIIDFMPTVAPVAAFVVLAGIGLYQYAFRYEEC